jgi:hypothetical protein
MNGIELAIQLREMLPACKVILFSGMAVTSDLVEDAKSRDIILKSWRNLFNRKSCSLI